MSAQIRTPHRRAHLQDGETLDQLALQLPYPVSQHPNLRESMRCVRIAGLGELTALVDVVLSRRSQRKQLLR